MSMATVTPQVSQLISQHRLGQVKRVYGPFVPGRIILGLVVAVIGVVWMLLSAAVTGSTLIPAGINPFHMGTPDGTGFGQYLPLFGAIFVLIGAVVIARAAWLAGARVAACDGGVAIATRKVNDAFRWVDVLTVTSRVDVHAYTHYTGPNGTPPMTTTQVRKRFTVHCHDGRTFLLDSALFGSRIQDLAETIQVNAARAAQPR
jgi:hypothetical protein